MKTFTILIIAIICSISLAKDHTLRGAELYDRDITARRNLSGSKGGSGSMSKSGSKGGSGSMSRSSSGSKGGSGSMSKSGSKGGSGSMSRSSSGSKGGSGSMSSSGSKGGSGSMSSSGSMKSARTIDMGLGVGRVAALFGTTP